MCENITQKKYDNMVLHKKLSMKWLYDHFEFLSPYYQKCIVPQSQILTEKFILKYKDMLECSLIVKNQQMSETFVEKEYSDIISRTVIIIYQQPRISLDYVHKHRNYIDLTLVCMRYPFTEKYLSDNMDLYGLYLHDIFMSHNLSKSFIDKYGEYVNSNVLKGYQYNYKNCNFTPIPIEDYAEQHNLKLTKKYLYAYRNHSICGRGSFMQTQHYKKNKYYRDWHCDLNPAHDNSYGFGIWPDGNTPVRVKREDWGTAVYDAVYDDMHVKRLTCGRKARVWGFEILNNDWRKQK